ncbi:Uncharacterised protein [Chlamydia trachomatis]|nr:Uncharacterised protein [Chlamydia trachomatis]
MVEVLSEIPELLVTSPYVQFKDGRAMVDAGTAERLKVLEWAGITVPEATTRVTVKKAASK